MKEMIKCCICGKEIDMVHSNNPEPVKCIGRCCNECNDEVVIPARIDIMQRLAGRKVVI